MEEESGYVSKYLTHFVGRAKAPFEQYAILKKILASRWLTHPPHIDQPTLGLEIHPGRRFAENDMMVPEMVCFCDIPVGHLETHTRKYSQFGIAFPKPYLIAEGANPVLYVSKNSGVLRRKRELRKRGLPKTTITPEQYAELKQAPMDLSAFASEPRGDVFEEYMRMFWELWYAKEPFEEGSAGPEVATVLGRDKGLWAFFVTHVLGFVKCFDDALPLDHLDNYYMEREWRRLGNLHFQVADVACVYVPPGMVDQCRAECADYADRVEPLSTG